MAGLAERAHQVPGRSHRLAVDLVAGCPYVIDLRGSPTDDGTLSDPYLRSIHDADDKLISGTTNDDGGEGRNSQLTFTATASGTHYIAAGAYSSGQGSYELEVTDTGADDARDGAMDLGDITGLSGPRFPNASLDGIRRPPWQAAFESSKVMEMTE